MKHLDDDDDHDDHDNHDNHDDHDNHDNHDDHDGDGIPQICNPDPDHINCSTIKHLDDDDDHDDDDNDSDDDNFANLMMLFDIQVDEVCDGAVVNSNPRYAAT